jgi:hypothetical protein
VPAEFEALVEKAAFEEVLGDHRQWAFLLW